jgi:glucuronoarabinoxylan endo-1,4-beta-xylanase
MGYNQIEAYINPANNNPVIVIINTTGSTEPITVALQNASARTMTPWVTDGSHNLAQESSVSVSGNQFSYTVPAYGVTTLVGSGGSDAGPTPTPTAVPSPSPGRRPPSII